MKILIVDDSIDNRLLLENILKNEGFTNIVSAESAEEAFIHLGLYGEEAIEFDLILMDVLMPILDGIEAVARIKEVDKFKDIPIIMVTAKSEESALKVAFEAGAVDYIMKPLKKVELLARIRSALRLKSEMDCRKARETELIEVTKKLEEANKILMNLSSLDGLTGINNRRSFDEFFDNVWRHAQRSAEPLSLILMDIDYFKYYNDTYGHQSGDTCLKKVSAALQESLNRTGDMVARYGGEEFAVVLENMESNEAKAFAEKLRLKIQGLNIEHSNSKVNNVVTISLGVATTVPNLKRSKTELIEAADNELYKAKNGGRNKVEGIELI